MSSLPTFAQIWTGSVSADWGNSNNWNFGMVPDGPGATAYFNMSGAPPNQPNLSQSRTLTSVQFNGRVTINIGDSASTLTFDPASPGLALSVNASGQSGFLYNSPLNFDCPVVFGGIQGTNTITGSKRVNFNRTVTLLRPLVINHNSTALNFGGGPGPAMVGSAPIIVQNTYSVVLRAGSSPSTYSGLLSLQNGSMHLYPGALGAGSLIRLGDTTGSASLTIAGEGKTSNNVLVAGGSTGNHALYFQGNPWCGLEGSLVLGSEGLGKDLKIQNFTSTTQELNSAISDPLGLSGPPGALAFHAYSTFPMRIGGHASNSHTGSNSVLAGVLELSKTSGANALGPGLTYVAPGAVLQHQSGVFIEQLHDATPLHIDGAYHLQGALETIGSLRGTGLVQLANGQLSVGAAGDSQFDGLISGAGRLRKVGASTFTLSQTNDYSGGTVIDGGRLELINTHGSATGPGPVWINPGGALSGVGQIIPAPGNSVIVTNGGKVIPGLSTSGALKLQFSGGGRLQLQSGSLLELSLGNAGHSGLAVNNLETAGALLLRTNGLISSGLHTVLTNITSHLGTFAQVLPPVGFGVDSHGWSNQNYFVVLRPATTWENWHQQHWGAGYPLEPLAGEQGDPDHDGLVNLLEYAFNLHPLQPDGVILDVLSGEAGLPRIGWGTGAETNRLVVEFLQRKSTPSPGISYQVLFADDLSSLGNWAINVLAVTNVTSLNPNWERVKVVDSKTSSAETKRFATVSVRREP